MTTFTDIKFTDPETSVTTYGTCSVQALDRYLAQGYEKATPEEAAKASRAKALGLTLEEFEAQQSAKSVEGPTAEDLENGLVLDSPAETPAIDGPPVDVVVEETPKTSDDEPPADVVKDSTAGDDAESKDDSKPGRAGRRSS